ncbi:MAG: hypothetical protein Ct9H300mP27_08960 [Chloroflexota bacterium]|nr:MAG: hypothetical protein Ct9H300mP27_08960 [Chloroflexota bacterium]
MARKATDARQIITLQCGDCRERNYTTIKNRRNDTQRMELRNTARVAVNIGFIGKQGNSHG